MKDLLIISLTGRPAAGKKTIAGVSKFKAGPMDYQTGGAE